ncbi:hypothetical protein D9619_008874 [Psilocybe cf. subviscida]|uniref:Heme haloperoxidase family profile domain-containing protein n=1 Tax=Psilocybe cf. subviscida TaxID=2480587 RepID=A0A8H5BBC2_9AGAR|nr:hypothetical protein D9619_008874 [Psilocybe cf. subviscida]
MAKFIQLSFFFLATLGSVYAFPSYGSLAGLSKRQLDEIIPTLPTPDLPSPPGPLSDTSAKLVNVPTHPYIAPGPNDIRGPCPGLNTLANHGYIPRNGIVTPGQIVEAVQEGFNMGNDFARFLAYAAHLVDGNLLTNLLSIGGKTLETGPDPPAPAIVGGLNTHRVFEGDASHTRVDTFLGDNHNFNETLFDKVSFSNKFGNGFYNFAVAKEFRFQLIQDSIAANSQFLFTLPRYFSAYSESCFPIFFWIDGRNPTGNLDLDVARSFFETARFPKGFFRANTPTTLKRILGGIDILYDAHPVGPGANNGTVNSYTVDPTSPDFSNFCGIYAGFVTHIVRPLYPDAQGPLLEALNKNLDFLYSATVIGNMGCTQVPHFT